MINKIVLSPNIEDEYKDKRATAYYSFLKTSTLIERQIKSSLRKYELTHLQLNVLFVLYHLRPTVLSLSELKQKLILDSPDLSRLVDRLVKKGLLSRGECKENRRKVNISITKSGVTLFEKAHMECKIDLDNFFQSNVSIKEAEALNDILCKMRNSLIQT